MRRVISDLNSTKCDGRKRVSHHRICASGAPDLQTASRQQPVSCSGHQIIRHADKKTSARHLPALERQLALIQQRRVPAVRCVLGDSRSAPSVAVIAADASWLFCIWPRRAAAVAAVAFAICAIFALSARDVGAASPLCSGCRKARMERPQRQSAARRSCSRQAVLPLALWPPQRGCCMCPCISQQEVEVAA